MKPLLFAIFCLTLTACTPKIQLETPAEGITINMNVVVDHKIDVRFDEKGRAILTKSENKQTETQGTVQQKSRQ